MPAVLDIIYYVLFFTAFFFSFKASPKNLRGLKVLRILLGVGIVFELLNDLLAFLPMQKNKLYYLYMPVEYALLSTFFYVSVSKSGLKRAILLFFPVYIALVTYFSLNYYHFNEFPSLVYNLGGFLNIIWATLALFSIEIEIEKPIYDLPNFWVYSAILILYMGIFFYNGVYNYFLQRETELAKSLRNVINLNFNYLFYIILIYAFICSIRLKKYIIR